MPPLDANTTASSPVETIEDEAAVETVAEVNADANAAESSDADDKDAKQPESLLAVVQDAVKKPEGDAGSSAAEGKEDAEPGAEAEAEPAKGEAEAEAQDDAKLPFHEHPRWKQVLAERDGFKGDAEAYRNITGFMDQHGLTGDEVAEGFDVMAKLKSRDPKSLVEARAYFADGLARLDSVLGNALPPELQEKVDAGLMDEEDAQELARSRATEKLQTQRLEERETADAAATAKRNTVEAARANATAVEGWEAQQKAADPDYSKKARLVEKTCFAIVQRTGKVPTTPEESLELCNAALKEVNDELKSMLPKRKPVDTRGPQGSSAVPTPEPKTLKDAIASAVNR